MMTIAIVAAAIVIGLACFDPIPSVAARFHAWMIALTVFAQTPIIGVGAGNFPDMARVASDYAAPYLAHNPYVQYLAETGIVGVVIAAPFVMTALIRMRSAWSDVAPLQMLRWGLLAALVFAWLHS